MNCKQCGAMLPENVKFCFECGAKVEKELVCRGCGTRLQPGAKFCMECGTSIGTRNEENILPFLNDENEENDNSNWDWFETEDIFGENSKKNVSMISGVLETLDPVARHLEFYSEDYRFADDTVINKNWIFYRDFDEKAAYIMDENGGKKVKLELGYGYAEPLCGMNNKGIWWMSASGESTWENGDCWNKLICYNPETNKKKTIEFNSSKASLDIGPYIYEDTAYYVASTSEGKQKVVKLDSLGNESVLYRNHEGEEIRTICADGRNVYIKVRVTEGLDYWGIIDFNGNMEKIGNESHPHADWLPLITIEWLDVHGKIMWTTMTEGERLRFGASEKDLVARRLGKPQEFNVLTWAKMKTAAIFRNGAGHSWGAERNYFDGKDMYISNDSWLLNRIDRNGNEKEVTGFQMHGETEKILVNDSYIFVNYDAINAVRLPRKFSAIKAYGKDNPEAVLVFGRGDYRL